MTQTKVSRLLALAVIYEGGTHSEASLPGDVGLQTAYDRVLRFGGRKI